MVVDIIKMVVDDTMIAGMTGAKKITPKEWTPLAEASQAQRASQAQAASGPLLHLRRQHNRKKPLLLLKPRSKDLYKAVFQIFTAGENGVTVTVMLFRQISGRLFRHGVW
ncbi:hypothetical protein [Neisseria iguanae]|uniref:Uncharacterized protein n=1 Tax=Neisseria iguanae TaxID=90242 RepID=A0A2P7TZQ4_9NEIS|nr:hypothetical protein [Neisseria iguanae]PSJ80199.1 hypothetical protein C7N83_07595 [Neisseria iguanae]